MGGGGGARREKERDVDDVKWRAKGEEREWDIGKVVLEEEELDVEGNGEEAAGKCGERTRRKLRGEVVLEAAWKRKGLGL